MTNFITLGSIKVEVERKDIKNLHLTVHPPNGRVHISAPYHMSLDIIRIFSISKLNWIKQQQKKFRDQERDTPREFIDRESHYVWGKRYLLSIMERDEPPSVDLKNSQIQLIVRPGTYVKKRQEIVELWYREQIREAIPPLIAKWEPLVGVKVGRILIQRMRTKWGGCNPTNRIIRLNTDLAKKPPDCLEYIIVHEMVHLIEPTHNERFKTIMERIFPKWYQIREVLNRLPVRHEDWRY